MSIHTLYGDGTHLVTVDEDTRVVSLSDKAGVVGLGRVEMSERAFGEVVLSWHRWRERMAENIPEQTVTPDGVETAEEAGAV
jgi:hypothetical protein